MIAIHVSHADVCLMCLCDSWQVCICSGCVFMCDLCGHCWLKCSAHLVNALCSWSIY